MHALSDPVKLEIGIFVIALSALGYGLLVGRITKSNASLAGFGVIGMAVLTAIFMVEHFFIPLQQPSNLTTLLPGVIGFCFLIRRRFLVELLILAAVTWWALQLARTGSDSYDHSLYHLQSAIWNTLDSAIPGLANIHVRLGFNPSIFVLASGMHIPDFGGWRLAFLGTALLKAMIATDLLLSIRSEKRIVRIYSLIVLVCLLFQPKWLMDPSYISPDPILALGIVYAVSLYLDKRTPMLLMCVPFLITVKLAALPLLLLLEWNRLSLKTYRVAATIGMLILTIWVARNVVLSGHLVFPVAATRLPVPWAEPKRLTVETAGWVTSWARDPWKTPELTSGIRWIRPWLLRMIGDERSRDAAWIAIAGIFLLAWKRELLQMDRWLLFVLAVSLMFWFLTAPDIRFGLGYVLAMAFLLLAYGADSIGLIRPNAGNAWVVIVLLAAGLALTAPRNYDPNWPKLLHPRVRLAGTRTLDTIWTPTDTDQCWDVIPCTPFTQDIEYYPKRALIGVGADRPGESPR